MPEDKRNNKEKVGGRGRGVQMKMFTMRTKSAPETQPIKNTIMVDKH